MTRMSALGAPKAIAGVLGAGLMLVAMPAAAQADPRIDRIERQISALQRAVFPGGDERFFEPEITPETRPTGTGTGTGTGVSSSAITDVLARLDAIESQLARLTAATEVNQNALARMEERVIRLEAGQATAATATPAPLPSLAGATPAPTPATRPTGVIPVPTPTPTPTPATTTPRPSAERVAAVQAIVKPATGDAGDDEYTYGFRLWEAGFYPEAQQQLARFLDLHPGHRQVSRGRNLLGRAFLDDGQPSAAASYFFENYQSDPGGERAGDSLLYLTEAMIAINDTNRACIALAEFGETYPALAIGRLQSMYDTLRGRVTCN